jgi:N-formylglutamate amidohydrolase
MAKAPNPFTLVNAETPSVPILLSVPHAGRDYPNELLKNLRVPAADLQRLEDRYADRLVQPAIAAGIPVIIAHKPRAWIDLNRAEDDLDTQMLTGANKPVGIVPSAKTRGGLGLIPRRLASSGELWRAPLNYAAVEARIIADHRPFHQQVASTLAAIYARFGIAILLDVHSMPPIPVPRSGAWPIQDPPQIVVGDRFGSSAASIYAELILGHITDLGLRGALNSPYSGDHILRTHGRPQDNIHALQLEIDRSLYLDSRLREPSGQIAMIAKLVHDVAMLLSEQALGSRFSQAAE